MWTNVALAALHLITILVFLGYWFSVPVVVEKEEVVEEKVEVNEMINYSVMKPSNPISHRLRERKRFK